MYTGPDVLNTLIGVLLRFRQERVAIVGDVKTIYHCQSIQGKQEIFVLLVVERRESRRKGKSILHDRQHFWCSTVRVHCEHSLEKMC